MTANEAAHNDRHYAALIRGSVWCGGLLGIVLFARRTRMFARYENVADIPLEVYRAGIELKGIVRAVHSNGYMKVEHVPAFDMPKFFSKRKSIQPGLLNLRLAGISVSDAGLEYLTKDLRLRSSQILFSPLKLVENNSCIDAEIFLQKKRFLQTNLNVDLVRHGFACLISLNNSEHLNTLKTNPAYSRLISKLIMSEKIADRRGLGLWARDAWVETMFSYPTTFRQIIRAASVTRFLLTSALVGKEVVIGGSRMLKQAVKIISVFSQKTFVIVLHLADALLGLNSAMKKKINKLSK